jgi:hypothetical protein
MTMALFRRQACGFLRYFARRLWPVHRCTRKEVPAASNANGSVSAHWRQLFLRRRAMLLQELYEAALLSRSAIREHADIREHLPTLYELALTCEHVTEMGTRKGWSTRAFLYAQPRVLVCYDLIRLPEVDMMAAAARAAGRPQFVFRQADVRQVEIEETDLLFIDTWHVYEQLKQELALHAGKVRRYLVFHDTVNYRERGDRPGHVGLWPAIEEFLWDNPYWAESPRPTANENLTILSRLGCY